MVINVFTFLYPPLQHPQSALHGDIGIDMEDLLSSKREQKISYASGKIGDRLIMFKSVASYSDKPLNTAIAMMHHGPILSPKIGVL